MESLTASLSDLRKLNYWNNHFVSEKDLYALMGKEAIKNALLDCNVPRHDLPEVVNTVGSGSRKIFAILLLNGDAKLITRFIAVDHLQRNGEFDKRLPLRLEDLRAILPQTPQYKLKLFLEKQWEFIPPVFSGKLISRQLPEETIFPITRDYKFGTGGFGDIFEIDISEDYCDFPKIGSGILVRKEFRSDEGNFELELENLSILQHLKHPNIVELLASYTHKEKHNLIFRRANNDLEDLLKGRHHLENSSNGCLIVSLAELSSALTSVHNFTSENPEISKSGCHHDLKPRNILVEGTRFILADFGLSKFKDPEQTSATRFQEIEDYYLAPECRDAESFKPNMIRRSSDIWSLGCIVAVFLTFLIKGPEGVLEFEKARKFTRNHLTAYYFHRGPEIPNEAVHTWLSKLERDCSESMQKIYPRTCGLFTALVKKMLSMNQNDRPKASEVEVQLCFIALENLSLGIRENLNRIGTHSIEALVEEKRFCSWQWALESPLRCNAYLPSTKYLIHSFTEAVRLLNQIADYSREIVDQLKLEPPRSRVFIKLRNLNLNLLSLLPQDSRSKSDIYLERELLGTDLEASDKIVETICDALQPVSISERLGMLATIRKVSILLEKNSFPSVTQLKEKPVLMTSQPGEKVVGYFVESKSKKKVLIEWKFYGPHWEKHGDELTKRVAKISTELNSIRTPEDLGILHCSGFYHSPDHFALGMVFEFPTSGTDLEIIMLKDILGEKAKKPFLETRFKLAYNLAKLVFDFHTLKWVHKGLSSSNIVFFKSPTTQAFEYTKSPYIVGFIHSRPDDEVSFTEGPPDGYIDYQHPEYAESKGERFRVEFDYYSLGIVLLELGLWQSVGDMKKESGTINKTTTREAFRDKLLKRRVSQLGQKMGSKYMEVVQLCMKWEQGDGVEAVDRVSGLDFHLLVVDKLSRCIV